MNPPVEFPPGALVLLDICPHGQPGRVTGFSRGKIIVEWADIGITGKHQPERLIHAVSETSQSRKPA